MHMQDKLTIDVKRRTRDGYLAVNARVARAGNVQEYAGYEVGRPDLPTVKVYRPADEVFSTETMQSFAHRPVTLGHPDSAVSSANWRDVAKGWSDGEVVRDGDFVRVSMLLADADAIAAVEGGTRELSMGYDCTLDWAAGTTPAGERYDAVQRGIRSNHIAVVPRGRGGPELRIGDSVYPEQRKELHMMTDAEKQQMRDSVRGMPLDQAAALPIFDDVRGLRMSGLPAERYCALLAGAVMDESSVFDGEARVSAAHDHMVDRMAGAWRSPVNDNRHGSTPLRAKDGRPLSSLSASDQAREQMIHDLDNAHKG